MLVGLFFVFFFFRAEDGIRDVAVTGVQTCALPIFTEGALQAALDRRGIEYALMEGEGAFYGPKIDLHMKDVLGRSWQMGTIQLDAIMPQRFGLTYMGADNREHTPYVVHRALL